MQRPLFCFAMTLSCLALLLCCTPSAGENKNVTAVKLSPAPEAGSPSPGVNPGDARNESDAKARGTSDRLGAAPTNLIKRVVVGDTTPSVCAEDGVLTYNAVTRETRFCLDGKLHSDHFGLYVDTFKSGQLAVIRNPTIDPRFDLVFLSVYGTEFFDDPFFQSGSTEISGRGTSCVTVKGDEQVDKEWSSVGKAKEEMTCPSALKGVLVVGEKFPPEEFVVSGSAPLKFTNFKR